jgi:excisionase family DNA binding protein
LALKREFLSTNQVAEVLGISPFTVRRYIQLRKLRAVKLEGSYRVRQTALDAFLLAREMETEEELAAMESEAAKAKKDSPRRVAKTVEPAPPIAKKIERPQTPKPIQEKPRAPSKKSTRVPRSRHEK